MPDCPPAVEHEAQRIAAQLVARGAAGDGRPPDGQTCNGSMFTRCAWSAPVASGWSRWACGRWSNWGCRPCWPTWASTARSRGGGRGPRRAPGPAVFSANYFCRLASAIFVGSGRRGSRSTTMMPVGRVGGACAVQSGVENALPRRDTVAPVFARVFHPAGAVHRLCGFRTIRAFTRSTVGGLGAAADPEHGRGEQVPAGMSGGIGPFGSSVRRTRSRRRGVRGGRSPRPWPFGRGRSGPTG